MGQRECNSRAAEVRSFIKSGVDSVCDVIHTTHDIHFSRRQKSEVSTAEATGVLLDYKRINVSQLISSKIYIYLLTINLTTLLVAQIIYGWIIIGLVNNKLEYMRKEAAVFLCKILS
jgi:hypothetical protein